MGREADDRFVALARRFLGRSSPKMDAEMGAKFDDRVEMAIELIAPGEAPIGFENFCVNVDDFEVTLSREEFDQLRSICAEYRVDDHYVENLTRLITDQDIDNS